MPKKKQATKTTHISNKKQWFHITHRNLGKTAVLHPHNPCVDGEPKIPRICVAPTIHQCLAAVPYDRQKMYVYVTEETPKRPHGVEDVGITGEMWFTKKTKFKRMMILQEEFLAQVWRPNDSGRGINCETDLNEYAAIQIDREWIEYLMHGM